MKFLSLVVLSGFLTVSCAHKKDCCKQDHCDKSQKSSCCQMKKEDCKDDSCKKEQAAPKTEEKKQ